MSALLIFLTPWTGVPLNEYDSKRIMQIMTRFTLSKAFSLSASAHRRRALWVKNSIGGSKIAAF
jgi:hypothetical protein